MPFQPNVVILKGRATDHCLPQTIVHIFSQWGSLMCEQGSGRAVNRPFYEAARGELGCQWRGLSHVCHVSTPRPWPVCFDGSTRLAWPRALFTLDMCQAGEFPLHEKLTAQIASEPQAHSIWQSVGFWSRTYLRQRDNRSWQWDHSQDWEVLHKHKLKQSWAVPERNRLTTSTEVAVKTKHGFMPWGHSAILERMM